MSHPCDARAVCDVADARWSGSPPRDGWGSPSPMWTMARMRSGADSEMTLAFDSLRTVGWQKLIMLFLFLLFVLYVVIAHGIGRGMRKT